MLLAPKGIPHTYFITSASGGSWLTTTTGKDFERFVKKVGRTAHLIELPQRLDPPTKEAIDHLTRTAKEFNIEIVGLPLH